jgi:hypothetical protein
MKGVLPSLAARKLPALVLFLTLVGAAPLFAQNFNINPPVFTVNTVPGALGGVTPPELQDAVNSAIASVFNNAIVADIKKEIGEINRPTKLIGAFANSSVFASHGATQRGFGGYRRFAVTVGPTIGFQLPSDPFSLVDQMDNMEEKLKKDGDIRLGMNTQVFNAQFGMNRLSAG